MNALPGFRRMADNQAAELSKLPEGVDEPPFVKQMKSAHKYRLLSNRTKLWWSATLALVPAVVAAFLLPAHYGAWAIAALLGVCLARTITTAMHAAKAHSEASVIDAKASQSIVEIEPEIEPAPSGGAEEVKA